jgi:hypothetical protein
MGFQLFLGSTFMFIFKLRWRDCNKTTLNHIFQLLKKDELIKVEWQSIDRVNKTNDKNRVNTMEMNKNI